MKLLKINSKTFSPKRLLGSWTKERSKVSRSEPPSFGSGSSSSGTPTSVLRQQQKQQLSGEWSDFSDTNLELGHAFKLIDRDNDGRVSRKQLEALLGLLGGESEAAVGMMLRELDEDEDGDGMSVEALMRRVGAVCEEGACDSELRQTFEIFDADGDGRITAEELFTVFTTIGDDRCTLEDCRRMIAGVDNNGDGFVCFDDFARMMDHQHQHQHQR